MIDADAPYENPCVYDLYGDNGVIKSTYGCPVGAYFDCAAQSFSSSPCGMIRHYKAANTLNSGWICGLKFGGNQVIRAKYKGSFGAVINMMRVDCLTTGRTSDVSVSWGQTVSYSYSMFDYTPVIWRFEFSAITSACFISIEMEWDPYIPDRPGFRPMDFQSQY